MLNWNFEETIWRNADRVKTANENVGNLDTINSKKWLPPFDLEG